MHGDAKASLLVSVAARHWSISFVSFLASLSCASLVNLHVCPSLLLYLSLDNKVNKPIPSSRVSAIYGLYGPTGRVYGPYGPTGRGYGPTGLRARALRLTGPPTGLRAGALKLTGLYGPTGPRAIRAHGPGLRAYGPGPWPPQGSMAGL